MRGARLLLGHLGYGGGLVLPEDCMYDVSCFYCSQWFAAILPGTFSATAGLNLHVDYVSDNLVTLCQQNCSSIHRGLHFVIKRQRVGILREITYDTLHSLSEVKYLSRLNL